jgi:hypothetical protein
MTFPSSATSAADEHSTTAAFVRGIDSHVQLVIENDPTDTTKSEEMNVRVVSVARTSHPVSDNEPASVSCISENTDSPVDALP